LGAGLVGLMLLMLVACIASGAFFDLKEKEKQELHSCILKMNGEREVEMETVAECLDGVSMLFLPGRIKVPHMLVLLQGCQ
jgi:hypothetical protein